jgi:7-carboxy-7-deazaguanine synthase
MQIFEIFQSLQGETSRAGLPMHFIRFAGCDLRCSYCDTPAARDPAAGRPMSVAEVLAAVSEAGDRRPPGLAGGEVMSSPGGLETGGKAGQSPSRASSLQPTACSLWTAITGGEPLLQLDDLTALLAALFERGRRVLIETSGAYSIDSLDARAVRILDVKTPGSGMADRMHWPNLDLLTPHDEVKFVLTGRRDYDWAKAVVARYRLLDRTTVLFGPAALPGVDAGAPSLDPAALARWILADALPVRLNLQLHKLLGLR